MSHIKLRALRAFLGLGIALAFAAQSAPVPLEAFFQNEAFTGAKLSPSGRYVAVGVTPKGGHTQLVVRETETLKAKAVASPKDADIDRIEWVNDDRMVFTVTSKEAPPGDPYAGPGLFA